jgi:hypothetical protein
MRAQEHFGRQSEAVARRRGESGLGKRARNDPPGPTKIKSPAIGGFFTFRGVGLDDSRCSTNATKGAFDPPQQSAGARRVQSPEAMAIEDNPPRRAKMTNPAISGVLSLGRFSCLTWRPVDKLHLEG